MTATTFKIFHSLYHFILIKTSICAGQLMDISFAANYAQVAVLERGVHLAFPPTLSDLD
jgi:hypothetical protein